MEQITRRLLFISQLLMTILVFALPLFFIPATWSTIPQAKMLIVSALAFTALILLLASYLHKGSITIPVSFILFSSLLLPVVYFLSALLSGDSTNSFVGAGVERDTVIAMVLWVFALCTIAVSFNSTKTVLKGYRALLYSASTVAILHLLMFLLDKSFFSLGGFITLPPASVVGSWHDLAIFLGLTVFISGTYVTSTFAEKHTKIISGISIVVSVITLALINARDVWMALLALSLLSILYFLAMKRFEKGASEQSVIPPQSSPGQVETSEEIANTKTSYLYTYGLFSGIAVISAIFVFFGTSIHSVIPDRIKVVEFEVRPSWEGTFAVASAVYQERGFLFGSGPNTFNRQWGLYKPSGVNETAFWNTDFSQGIGFIPTSVINSGILGGFVWLLFFSMLLYRGARTLYSPPNDGDGRWHGVFLGLFGGVLYLWFFHLVYPPGVGLLALTFILTGIFIASQRVSGAIKTKTISFRDSGVTGIVSIVLLCLIILVAFFALLVSLRALSTDMFINRSVTTFNKTESVADARKELNIAVLLDANNARAHRAAVELGIIEFQRFVQEGDTSEERLNELRSALEATINHGLTAVSTNESDYQNWLTLARLYEQLAGVQIEGAYANAQAAYERAAAENPTNPEPFARLGQLAITQGDIESARENLQLALSIKSNYPIAHFLLSQIEASVGNIEEAIISAENAALSAPQEPLAWFQIGVLHHGAENYEAAIDALEQAVALNGNYANALYVLGLDYVQVGRLEDALLAFERVRELNPDNQAVVDLINSLETEPTSVAEDSIEE